MAYPKYKHLPTSNSYLIFFFFFFGVLELGRENALCLEKLTKI